MGPPFLVVVQQPTPDQEEHRRKRLWRLDFLAFNHRHLTPTMLQSQCLKFRINQVLKALLNIVISFYSDSLHDQSPQVTLATQLTFTFFP